MYEACVSILLDVALYIYTGTCMPKCVIIFCSMNLAEVIVNKIVYARFKDY